MNIKQLLGTVLTAQGLSLLSKEEALGADRALLDRAHKFVGLITQDDFRRIAADYHRDGPLSWSAIRAMAWGVKETMLELGEPYLAQRAGEFVDESDEAFAERLRRASAAFLNDPASGWVRIIGGQAPGADLGEVVLANFRGETFDVKGGDVRDLPDGVYQIAKRW